MKNNVLVRSGLLIALTLVLQSLRLIIPLPGMVSMFFVGTLVNMMLLLVYLRGCRAAALLLCFMLPITAYMEGQVKLPILIPLIIVGNVLYVELALHFKNRLWLFWPAVVKAVVMGAGAFMVVEFLQMPPSFLRSATLFSMSVPQFVTGISGLWCLRLVEENLIKN